MKIYKADTTDGINIVIDDRWAALFPKETEAQIDLLIEALKAAIGRPDSTDHTTLG